MPVAFVLSAGGSLGDFEVGALRFLYNRGIRPDIVCGSSVGAINGAAIAQGTGGLEKLESIWLSLQLQTDMYIEQPWVTRLPGTVRDLLHRVRDTVVRLPDQILVPILLFDNLVRFGIDAASLIDAVTNALRERGIWDTSPLAAKIRDNLSVFDVANSGIRLRLAVCSLEAGVLRFVNELGRFQDGPAESMDVRDAVLASSAIPAFFPPVRLGNDFYVDGGVRTLAPIGAAVQAGATEIYAVVAPTSGVGAADSFAGSNIADIAQRSLAQQYDQILESDLRPPGGWPATLWIIQPDLVVHGGMQVEPGLIWISMGYGFMRAADVMRDGVSGPAHELSNQITRRRLDLWDREHGANNHTLPSGTEPQPLPPGGVNAVEAWLPWVRERKRQLRELVAARRLLFDADPMIAVSREEIDFGDVLVPASGLEFINVLNVSSGATPPDANRWWREWERHPWQPLIANPWEGFIYFGTDFGAEDPPADLSSIDVDVSSITADDAAFQPDVSRATIREGEALALGVRFTPATSGAVEANLTVTSNGGVRTVLLRGRGVVRTETIDVRPDTVRFGNVQVGSSVSEGLTIRNVGSADLVITDVLVEDPEAAFSLSTAPSSGHIIRALQSTHVTLDFSPVRAGPHRATLFIESTDTSRPRAKVALIGLGFEPLRPD
jgi:predicted acylesterase/phospholipase RssA